MRKFLYLNLGERRFYFSDSDLFKLTLTAYVLRWKGLLNFTFLSYSIDFKKSYKYGEIDIFGYLTIRLHILGFAIESTIFFK